MLVSKTNNCQHTLRIKRSYSANVQNFQKKTVTSPNADQCSQFFHRQDSAVKLYYTDRWIWSYLKCCAWQCHIDMQYVNSLYSTDCRYCKTISNWNWSWQLEYAYPKHGMFRVIYLFNFLANKWQYLWIQDRDVIGLQWKTNKELYSYLAHWLAPSPTTLRLESPWSSSDQRERETNVAFNCKSQWQVSNCSW